MGRKKVAPAGGKQLPADDLLRLLHSQNLGKIRTLVKSGLDPNGFVSDTSCFDSTTWVLKDRKPLVPILVFSCFNGVPAPVLDLLIRLGASPNAVTDCGLPGPLAVLCAKITAEEQRALFQVLRQHRCTTFNSSVRSARNEQPIQLSCKVLDLSDWTAPRKVEGVELLIQFGTFQLPDGGLDERAIYEFVATAVRQPCGHKLLDCLWRHYPQRLLPSLPLSGCLLLRAVSDSWLDLGWRRSDERQHTVSMGLVLRALLEHPAMQQPQREAVAFWLRTNMTVLLYRPELVASLLDRCRASKPNPPSPSPPLSPPPPPPPPPPPIGEASEQGQGQGQAQVQPPTTSTSSSCTCPGSCSPAPPQPSPSPSPPPPPLHTRHTPAFHPDDRDLVLPVGLLNGPEAAQGEVPLAPNMSLLMAYVVDPDEQLARQGVEMLLGRGARVDLPCRLGREVLGDDGDSGITPLVVAFMPYHRNQALVELLWQRYAETEPALATPEAAIRMRAAAHALFLRLPGWLGPLDSAARAAAAGVTDTKPSAAGGGASTAVMASAAANAAVTPGSVIFEAAPLDCSRERLRDLLDNNVLDYVDNRNLDLVEAALTELLTQLSNLLPSPPPLPADLRGGCSAGGGCVTTNAAAAESWDSTGDQDAEKGSGSWDAADLATQLSVVSERLERAHARLDELYSSERSDAEMMDDPEVWRAEAVVEALAAVQRCLQRTAAAAAANTSATIRFELPAGVAFVEVIAARIVGQPEWGFSRGLLLQLGLCQMRRVLRALQAEGGGGAGAGAGAGSSDGGVQGVVAQMEVVRLYYEELFGSMSLPERRMLEDLVSALEAAEKERELEEEAQGHGRERKPGAVATVAEAEVEAEAEAEVEALAAPSVDGDRSGPEDGSVHQVHQELLQQRLMPSPPSQQQQHRSNVQQGIEEVAVAECSRDEVLQGGDEGGERGAPLGPQDGLSRAGSGRELRAGGGGCDSSTGQPLSACSAGHVSSSTCSCDSSSSRSSLEVRGRLAATATAAATLGMAADPSASATAAATAAAEAMDAVAQGFLTPQAREAMHRAMLPGELIGEWTGDDDDEEEDEGVTDGADGSAVAARGGGCCSGAVAASWQVPTKPRGARGDRGVACPGACHGGGDGNSSNSGSAYGGGCSGCGNGSSTCHRKGRNSCSTRRRRMETSSAAVLGGGPGPQSSQPLPPSPLSQQPSRRRLNSVGAVGCAPSGHRRSRRLYGSNSGGASLPDGFLTSPEDWRDPELLLGGLNVMSLPPNVRHRSGGGGGDGNSSSSSSDRELAYEYLGAAVMFQNHEDSGGGNYVNGGDSGRGGSGFRQVTSSASSAYDTPSEGSGDEATSLLEAQIRACRVAGSDADAAAASRRLSAGLDANSENSYGSAQGCGGYGVKAHGYGPEYGLESVGGDMGALDSGVTNRLICCASGGNGSGAGAGRWGSQPNAAAALANSGGTALLLPPPRPPPSPLLESSKASDCRCNGNGQESRNATLRSPRGSAAASAADAVGMGSTVAPCRSTRADGAMAPQCKESCRITPDGRITSTATATTTNTGTSPFSPTSSTSPSFIVRPMAELGTLNLFPLRTWSHPQLATTVIATATATAPHCGRTEGTDVGGATTTCGSLESIDGGGAAAAAAAIPRVSMVLTAGTPVGRTSSSCSSRSSYGSTIGDAASCHSSLDSTCAYIVHKTSVAVGGDDSGGSAAAAAEVHPWAGPWVHSRSQDRCLGLAAPPPLGRRQHQKGSQSYNYVGGESSGDEYVHTYDSSYDYVIAGGRDEGGGGGGGAAAASGDNEAVNEEDRGRWFGSSCRLKPAGSSAAAAMQDPWACGRQRYGIYSYADADGGLEAARTVVSDRWGLRGSGVGAGGGGADPGPLRTVAGSSGRQRRRVVARRKHVVPMSVAAAAAASPLRQPEALPLPPASRSPGLLYCSDASEGSQAGSESGGGRRRSSSKASYDSDGSVLATVGRVRQQWAASQRVPNSARAMQGDGADDHDRGGGGGDDDAAGDGSSRDSSIALCPGGVGGWNRVARFSDGERSGHESGRKSGERSDTAGSARGLHRGWWSRGCGGDGDGDNARGRRRGRLPPRPLSLGRQRHACDISGFGGGEEADASSEDASSTSTQEWPPRRPASIAITSTPTTTTTTAVANTTVPSVRFSVGASPARTTPSATAAASAAATYGSSENYSDPPGSVGFSGRRPECGGGHGTGSGSETELDGDAGRAASPLYMLGQPPPPPPPLQPNSDSDSGSRGMPMSYAHMCGWRSTSTTSSDSSTAKSRPTPVTGQASKRSGALTAAEAAAAAAAAARRCAWGCGATADGVADIGDSSSLIGLRVLPDVATAIAAAAAATAVAGAAYGKTDGGGGDGNCDGDDDDDERDNDDNDDSLGVSGRWASACVDVPASRTAAAVWAPPSSSPPRSAARSFVQPVPQPKEPNPQKEQHGCSPNHQPLPQLTPLARIAPAAAAVATTGGPPASSSLSGGADRVLSALLANLASASNVLPRTYGAQWTVGGISFGPVGATKTGPGPGHGSGGGAGTASDGGGAAAAAVAALGGGGGVRLQNCYVLRLSDGAQSDAQTYAAPPDAVMRALSNGPSGPEVLSHWAAELRGALVACSGCEHQRLLLLATADSPAVRVPGHPPPWLSALRAAVVGAVLGPALAGDARSGAGAGPGLGAPRFQEQLPGRRRCCPYWLRQTVLLLPLCHLIVPYGGAYLYQAASRAYQEHISGPTASSSSPSPACGRSRVPHLWLDAECLAAAVAFAEEYPGNMYGRAILMQFVSRQISRALLRSPRCGLRGVARSAEALMEVLHGGSGGGGGGCGSNTAVAADEVWPVGPTGQFPSSTAALLLLLEDDDEEGDDEDNDVEAGGAMEGEGGGSTEGDGGDVGDVSEGEEEGRALRAVSVTCHVLGSALSAARQMQAVWRATWPGGHSLRLASYSYLAASGYPRAVVSALNWCVPLVLDGVVDLSELLAEMRLLSYNPSTALVMAEEIFAPNQPVAATATAAAAATAGKGSGGLRPGGSSGGSGLGENERGYEEYGGHLVDDQGSDTVLAFKHLVNALRAAVAPYPQPLINNQLSLLINSRLPRAELAPWSRLSTRQREQLVDELLTLADLLMIAHAVLLTLRTALSYAVDDGGAALALAAAALRREVAEVQTMRAAASRMLVERMETQERSTESSYPNHLPNCRNRYHSQHGRPDQSQLPSGTQSSAAPAKSVTGPVVNGHAAAAAAGGDVYMQGENACGSGSSSGRSSRRGGGDGGGGGGCSGSEGELDERVDERVSWRHVNGLYEHGKTILQCAADAAVSMLDPQTRAEDAARCGRLVTALLQDHNLMDDLTALATMPQHHQLPLAPLDPSAAAAAAAVVEATANPGRDPALQAAVTAATAAASFSQCNEVLYRLLVLPWSDDGGGGECTSLTEEFERSSWSIPTLIKGEFRPLTQPRVRRLYDEVRGLAAECLCIMNRIAQPPAAAAAASAGVMVAAASTVLMRGGGGDSDGAGNIEGGDAEETEVDAEGGGLDDPS